VRDTHPGKAVKAIFDQGHDHGQTELRGQLRRSLGL